MASNFSSIVSSVTDVVNDGLRDMVIDAIFDIVKLSALAFFVRDNIAALSVMAVVVVALSSVKFVRGIAHKHSKKCAARLAKIENETWKQFRQETMELLG